MAHLAVYNDIDVALDVFPWNGHTSACEALWMGVPVLAVLGGSMISRQSASLLGAAGLEGWVADSPDGLANLAASRAADLEALAAQRAGMRARLQASPLMDARAFAARFEALLREIAPVR